MAWPWSLLVAVGIYLALGALNVEQAVEDSMFELRSRIFVADALLENLPEGRCDSNSEGPFCEDAGVVTLEAESLKATNSNKGVNSANWQQQNRKRPAQLVDGLLSAQLFGSSAGDESVDEFLLGANKKKELSSSGGRGRSAYLNFFGLEPWRVNFPSDFTGSKRPGGGGLRGGFPFAVHWDGPWMLSEVPGDYKDPVVRPGRFMAELRGPVGTIRFGRPVYLQAVDLMRPVGNCLDETAFNSKMSMAQYRLVHEWKPKNSGEDVGTRVIANAFGLQRLLNSQKPQLDAVPLRMPLLIRGRRSGKVVFTEVVGFADMTHLVNGIEFTVSTTAETVDEVSFVAAECVLVGHVQASFSDRVEFAPPANTPPPASRPIRTIDEALKLVHESRASPQMIKLRDAVRAFGWEDVDFHGLSKTAHLDDAPLWNLIDVVRHRQTLRKGAFTYAPPMLNDHLQDDEIDPKIGPELMNALADIEEVPPTTQPDIDVDSFMNHPRNVSQLMELATAISIGTTVASLLAQLNGVASADAAVLNGFSRHALNHDLILLLSELTEVVEDEGTIAHSIVAASTASDIFDAVWRRLGLDTLDCLLVRWRMVRTSLKMLVYGGNTLEQLDVKSLSTAEQHARELPGVELTQKLFDAIRLVDETIGLQVQAKHKKLEGLTSKLEGLASKLDTIGADGLRAALQDSGQDFQFELVDSKTLFGGSSWAVPGSSVQTLLLVNPVGEEGHERNVSTE